MTNILKFMAVMCGACSALPLTAGNMDAQNAVIAIAADEHPEPSNELRRDKNKKIDKKIKKNENIKTVAVVNNEVITNRDIENRVNLLLLFSNTNPDANLRKLLTKHVTNSIINEKMMVHYANYFAPADKNKQWVSQKEVLEEFANISENNNLSPEEFLKILKDKNVNIETFYQQIHAKLTWNNYISAKYAGLAKPTDEDVKKKKEQICEARKKKAYKVERIFFPFTKDPASRREAEEMAAASIKLISAGIDFQSLARQFSCGSEAAYGGTLGYITNGQLPFPEENCTLAGMHAGEIKQTVTKHGISIIRVLAVRLSCDKEQDIVNIRHIIAPLQTGENEEIEREFSRVQSLLNNCKTAKEAIKIAEKNKLVITPESEMLYEQMDPNLKNIIKDVKADSFAKPICTGKEILVPCVIKKHKFKLPVPKDDEIVDRIIDEKLHLLSEMELHRARSAVCIERK